MEKIRRKKYAGKNTQEKLRREKLGKLSLLLHSQCIRETHVPSGWRAHLNAFQATLDHGNRASLLHVALARGRLERRNLPSRCREVGKRCLQSYSSARARSCTQPQALPPSNDGIPTSHTFGPPHPRARARSVKPRLARDSRSRSLCLRAPSPTLTRRKDAQCRLHLLAHSST